MSVLIAIAFKSLLIGGLTLGLLHLMRKRSAAERSWVAHAGLVALMVMALAPLVLPSWKVETPAMFGRAEASAAVAAPTAKITPPQVAIAKAPATAPVVAAARQPTLPRPHVSLDPIATAIALYAVPAAVLLFITFLALARLVALQARAEVLVDGHWLSALARAQRRMGFKHGTALLTSNDLSSPISWGLVRPVILLNSRAVEATKEAEAIIAHELAHVARLDWLKLLLARFATAFFWFNPLVWLLAREAHQLREEAADDSVLASDIVDTDYAQLLVGVARHECPGLLLGAHGVAPSRSSLGRRVARVLDGKSARGPAARGFALGVFTGAVLVAAPLAALTLTPGKDMSPPPSTEGAPAKAVEPYYGSSEVPADLPSIIASGVSTSVHTAVAAATAAAPAALKPVSPDFHTEAPNGATVDSVNGVVVAHSPSGAESIVYPPDAQGRRMVVSRGPSGARAVAYVNGATAMASADGDARHSNHAIERMIEMKAVGVTPEYLASVRAASPALRDADLDDIVGMRAVGVTPEYIRDLAAAGLPSLDVDELTQARAVGVDPAYVRAMSAAGFRGSIDEFVEMRAVGITPEYANQFRKSGYSVGGPHQLIKLKVHGATVDTLRQAPRSEPRNSGDDPDG